MRKAEEAETKWVDTLCSWAGQINILKMPLLYKATCRFYEALFKILMMFLNRNWIREPSETCMEAQRSCDSWRHFEQLEYCNA